MLPVPTPPNFANIDLAALEGTDWTNDRAAAAALRALQRDLEANTASRVRFLNESLAASVERVKIMQAGLDAAKKKKDPPGDIDTDAKLKTARDEVKQMSLAATQGERDFYAAMSAFRQKPRFDFAGKFTEMLTNLRSSTQDSDKAVASIPGKLKSLEGFASGLIKEIRELRGDVKGNLERMAKLRAAGKKATTLANEAGLTIKKVKSALTSMDSLIPKLPATAKELDGRINDLTNANERFFKAMGAIETLKESMIVMSKAFDGKGFKESAAPEIDAVEKLYKDLLKERDGVQKTLNAVHKNKDLPKEYKKELPEKL